MTIAIHWMAFGRIGCNRMTTHNVRLTPSPILSARQSFSFPRYSLGNTSNSLVNKIFIIDWPRFTWCNMRPIVFFSFFRFTHIRTHSDLSVFNESHCFPVNFIWIARTCGLAISLPWGSLDSIRVNMWRGDRLLESSVHRLDFNRWLLNSTLLKITTNYKESWCFSIFPELYLQNIKTIVSIRTFHISSGDCIVYGKPVTKVLLV